MGVFPPNRGFYLDKTFIQQPFEAVIRLIASEGQAAVLLQGDLGSAPRNEYAGVAARTDFYPVAFSK